MENKNKSKKKISIGKIMKRILTKNMMLDVGIIRESDCTTQINRSFFTNFNNLNRLNPSVKRYAF